MGHCSCGSASCTQNKNEKQQAANATSLFTQYGRVAFSLLLLITGMLLTACDAAFFTREYIAFGWYLLAYFPVGIPVLREAWESLKERDYFNEFTLMSVATLGAFYLGDYPEGIAVMVFYTVGELFQDRAVDNARRNIETLLDVRPETVLVRRGERFLSDSPRNVRVGETIQLKAGGRVPLDGILLNGTAAFNTSALTGESVPRDIEEGEEVLAGMIVSDKVIRLKVTRSFDKSTLARILELVEQASERKAPTELFIRKFARVYTPVVFGLAVLTVLFPWVYSWIHPSFEFVLQDWLYKALIFLVISCPCALVVSIPLGYFGGIGAASRLGILFKGGNYLDAVTKINTVVFDKTGTLTKGTFEVQSVRCEAGIPEEELIALIASAEQGSTHPIANAITDYARRRGVELVYVAAGKEYSGYGVEALIGGTSVLVGNVRLLAKFGIAYPAGLLSITDTLVLCAANGKYIGCLSLSDVLKEDAFAAIRELKNLGIEQILILSGDKQSIVTEIARKLGVPEAYGDMLPADKVKHLEELQRQEGVRVAFVGDGMNDAPVLALSRVGIAMGGLGSEAAIETADVVIQTDHPSKVPQAIRLGKQTRRIVWQNIALAFSVKLIVLTLGTVGMATLWEAVFADVGVALLAILNAVRIQKMIK